MSFPLFPSTVLWAMGSSLFIKILISTTFWVGFFPLLTECPLSKKSFLFSAIQCSEVIVSVFIVSVPVGGKASWRRERFQTSISQGVCLLKALNGQMRSSKARGLCCIGEGAPFKLWVDSPHRSLRICVSDMEQLSLIPGESENILRIHSLRRPENSWACPHSSPSLMWHLQFELPPCVQWISQKAERSRKGQLETMKKTHVPESFSRCLR